MCPVCFFSFSSIVIFSRIPNNVYCSKLLLKNVILLKVIIAKHFRSKSSVVASKIIVYKKHCLSIVFYSKIIVLFAIVTQRLNIYKCLVLQIKTRNITNFKLHTFISQFSNFNYFCNCHIFKTKLLSYICMLDLAQN